MKKTNHVKPASTIHTTAPASNGNYNVAVIEGFKNYFTEKLQSDASTNFSGNAKWQKTLFPGTKPTERKDAIILDKWIEETIAQVFMQTMNADFIEFFNTLQEIFSIAMHELTRQVSVQCVNRGRILGKIWVRYVDLFNYIVNLCKSQRTAFLSVEQESIAILQY